MKFELPIEGWAARAGNLKTEQEWRQWFENPEKLSDEISHEKIEGISPMMLRRAGRIGSAAVSIGKQLLTGISSREPLSVVTVSELGELESSDVLIESVVSGSALSPQKFAASVHNHILGQMCINLNLPCCGGASTGARSGLEMGLIEGLSELEMGCRALVLAFEPKVDKNYADWCGGRSPEHVIGVMLRSGASNRLLLEKTFGGESSQIRKPYALHWLSLLAGVVDELYGREGWHWKHVAC